PWTPPPPRLSRWFSRFVTGGAGPAPAPAGAANPVAPPGARRFTSGRPDAGREKGHHGSRLRRVRARAGRLAPPLRRPAPGGDGPPVPAGPGARGDRRRRLPGGGHRPPPRGHAPGARGPRPHPPRPPVGVEGRGDARPLHPRRPPAPGHPPAPADGPPAADGGRRRRLVHLGAAPRPLARGAAGAGPGHAQHLGGLPAGQNPRGRAPAPALRPLP